ncbi:MAG: DEAD/DEAH box helicase, partial [Myxococcales bacterium]|nr:DEAD/DEAH box helicase [Myxococcales bacterium]
MSTWRYGVFPAGVAAQLLEALARAQEVTLDGEPVKASAEPVTPVAVVRDAGPGFSVELVADPQISEMFKNRVVLHGGDTLRPVGQGGLSDREIQELRAGRVFRPEDTTELMTQVLPELEARIPVVKETKRLPDTVEDTPRLLVEVTEEDDVLTVLPTLVYGDPPVARVDRGRLVLLTAALPIRDERHEEHLTARLARQLGLEPGRRATFEGEKAVAFAARLEQFHAGEVIGDAHERYFLAPPMRADVALDDVSGDARVTFESDGQSADPRRVLRAWQRGLQLAPLDDGGWAPIPRDWLTKYGEALSSLLALKEQARQEGEDAPLPMAAFADVVKLAEALGQRVPARFERLRTLAHGFEGIPAAALPADLTAELRHYQRDGVDWLALLRDAGLGALLADDMGLGKTLQALTVVRGKTLVVAPTSVLFNWANEAARFRPSLRTSVYHGAKRALEADADLVITSYALLRLDPVLTEQAWDTVILDEAQAIKNPESQVAQAASRLRADFRLTLTGTPVENRLDDLWSQLNFANPGLLGTLEDFRERYAQPIADGKPGVAARLRERTRPFILRRMKRDVAKELPPRTDVVLRSELAPAERDLYDAMRLAARKDVIEQLAGGGSVLAALEALLRLRQAACHPGLLPGQEAPGSSKVTLLVELLEEMASEGHKGLVFSQWTGLLDLVEPHLRDAGLDFVRLDGSTRDRGAVVDAFQADDGPPVMLLSLKAGGTGLNLTAADHVFLLDPWWNPAVEDQAADRAHRIGQDKPVLVHRLVSADTVEERILALQAAKRQLA